MGYFNLDSIWAASSKRLDWYSFQALLQAGVPASALVDRERHDNYVGVCNIGFDSGRWVERFNGESAYIIPIRDRDDDIVDLVAFKLKSPKAYWCAEKNAFYPCLGEYEEIDKACFFNDPLEIHQTPLDWLRADRQGVVLLDWHRHWSFYFEGVAYLKTNSEEFAMRLLTALEKPFSIPDVRFPSK